MCLKNMKKPLLLFIKTTFTVFLMLSIVSCKEESNNNMPSDIEDKEDTGVNAEDEEKDTVIPIIPNTKKEETKNYKISVTEEGNIIFYSSQGYYRYGPSIIEYDDGSMDMWLSAPGNSGSQWDWITYRHSDDGINWSSEQIVLRPTPGSKDQCSVCDPGVIYFNDYYYLAYTGTDYYEGKGSNNSAFVARSTTPYGPFEKWNGEGWGGYPQPIIKYEGDPSGWGIGEVSFVILEEDLFIYCTYMDKNGGNTRLYKADLVDDWPKTIRFKENVLAREHQDSLDVAYDEELKMFFGFSIYQRMANNSRLIMYGSKNGKEFSKLDSTKDYIEDYAHNVGISKSVSGHINSSKNILVGYAFGENWGRWNLKVQNIKTSY